MIDLHTHTTESDGSLTPVELLQLAHDTGLKAVAITDHDTLTGYDMAKPVACVLGIELICGIELSTRYKGKSVHLLGYFLKGAPSQEFRDWVVSLQVGRHVRNRQLVAKLQAKGFNITLEEVCLRGRKLPGRPHFASILVEKGYASSIQTAFDEYLDEKGACFVPRDEPSFEDAAARIVLAGGLPALPHPVRISRDAAVIENLVRDMQSNGLRAIEAFHSDHSPAEISLYTSLARRCSLAVTGGSDFHGSTKPHIALGTGQRQNLRLSLSLLEELRGVI
jgi:3',5'-nucleoside bisphosphate phosphatase